MAEYSFSSLIRKRTVILGDLGAGKTKLTRRLLKQALTTENPERITVIDIAPERRLFKGLVVGGVIADPEIILSGVRLLKPREVNAPRCSARDRDELMRQVEENRVLIEETLDLYLHKATPILFINDLSLYFQSGRFEKALEVMELAETFVANAYHGEALEEDLGTGVSVTERRVLESFAAKADVLVHL
ncbi:MAG: hypothetical protein QXK96_03505 [Candidatus Bathyarchaeia archaeon]